MSPALIAPAVAAFTIGTPEFVMIGLVPDVARDVTGTQRRAGLLVTGCALTVTVGAPTATQRWLFSEPLSEAHFAALVGEAGEAPRRVSGVQRRR